MMKRLLASVAFIGSALPVYAAELPTLKVDLMPGQVEVIRSEAPYQKAIVGAPEIADVNVMTDYRFSVTAGKEGYTTVLLTDDRGGPVQKLDIQVVSQIAYKRSQIRVITSSRQKDLQFWCTSTECQPDPGNFEKEKIETRFITLPDGGGSGQAVTKLTSTR
jgi:Pilus formation protein N terminal region